MYYSFAVQSVTKKKTNEKTLLAAFTCIAFATVNAQTTSPSPVATQTVTLNLQNQIDIDIVEAPGTGFTFANTNDYATGLTNKSASSFRVRSNKNWVVTVAAATDNFSSSAATTMPSTVLSVRLTGTSNFSPLTKTAVDLTSGTKGGNNTFAVDYKANPKFDYDSGNYTLNVVYTATQQ